MAGGARALLVGLLLVTAKGKMTFLSVYFGKAPERMLEQLFFPCWQIRPRDIPVCHSSDSPLAQAGLRLDHSTVLIRVIEILRTELSKTLTLVWATN